MKYFAYGSNMSTNRLSERKIFPSDRKCAVLKGYSLKFNKVATANAKEGKANIVTDGNGTVEGILYEVTEAELKKLDKAEGVSNGDYFRATVSVSLKDGSTMNAVTYIANPMRTRNGLKPTKEYRDYLLDVKDCLSPAYIEWLEKTETLD